MSRLYLKADTDAIKTQKTARGHTRLSVRLCYGSKGDSRCVPIEMTWQKGGEPVLWIDGEKYKTYKYP